jgi:hypothetical protein
MMFNQLHKLYLTLQTGEGFSVRKDLLTYKRNTGYAVGGAVLGGCYETDNESLSFIAFEQMMDNCRKAITDADHQVIGGWVDDHGTAFVEVSDVVQSIGVAMQLAELRNERAIYSFEDGKSIDNPKFKLP